MAKVRLRRGSGDLTEVRLGRGPHVGMSPVEHEQCGGPVVEGHDDLDGVAVQRVRQCPRLAAEQAGQQRGARDAADPDPHLARVSAGVEVDGGVQPAQVDAALLGPADRRSRLGHGRRCGEEHQRGAVDLAHQRRHRRLDPPDEPGQRLAESLGSTPRTRASPVLEPARSRGESGSAPTATSSPPPLTNSSSRAATSSSRTVTAGRTMRPVRLGGDRQPAARRRQRAAPSRRRSRRRRGRAGPARRARWRTTPCRPTSSR